MTSKLDKKFKYIVANRHYFLANIFSIEIPTQCSNHADFTATSEGRSYIFVPSLIGTSLTHFSVIFDSNSWSEKNG
jgi:hypothetical protein